MPTSVMDATCRQFEKLTGCAVKDAAKGRSKRACQVPEVTGRFILAVYDSKGKLKRTSPIEGCRFVRSQREPTAVSLLTRFFGPLIVPPRIIAAAGNCAPGGSFFMEPGQPMPPSTRVQLDQLWLNRRAFLGLGMG